MFVLKTLSVAVAVAIFAVAHPTSHLDFEKSVAETLKAAPAGWVQNSSEEVDKDATSITLKIHLVNKDMDKFHERAMNVSAHSSRRDRIVIDMLHRSRHLVMLCTAGTCRMKRFLRWSPQPRSLLISL
jgi:hypothetical protein